MPIKLNVIKAEDFDNIEFDHLSSRPRTDWTKYYKEKSIKSGNVFVDSNADTLCVDGEGYTTHYTEEEHRCTSQCIHHYYYIAASNHDGSIVRDLLKIEGISTEDCFWFLVNLPSTHRKVGYSFNYDVNMMLKDIDERRLRILWERGFVWWKGWGITWTPSKMFSVKRQSQKYGPKSCTVWDIFGYFQKPFVETIFKWKVGTEEDLRFVTEMKLRRNQFTTAEVAIISSYCQVECKLGAQVFNKLLECTRNVGLKLRRYDGAGSVAAAMLKLHSIADYMHQTNSRIPDEVICSGYYGGRFDISTFGTCGGVFEYDINSAYPYQALSLPCLSCSTWEYTRDYDGGAPWAIWNTSWNLDESALWSPFPYRDKHGIHYLRSGSGWYWANEVREAIAFYPSSVQIKEGYILRQHCDHKPFEFIRHYYEQRKRLEAMNDLAEKVIKLGLNSLYGKLAQSVGRFQSIPQTQCLIWAGIITSNTRAMLLSQIRNNPDDVIMVATDAIFTRAKSNAIIPGTELGQWKDEYLSDLFIVSNGFYQGGRSGEVTKTRGMSRRDMYDKDHNINHWKNIRRSASNSGQFIYQVPVTDFIGLGESLGDKVPLTRWRKWISSDRRINYGQFRDKEIRNGQLYPGINNSTEMSAPFDPKLYRQDDAPLLDVDDESEDMVD